MLTLRVLFLVTGIFSARIKRDRNAIINEDSESETKRITPARKDESIIVPTAPITKAGPAFTELRAILLASL